MIKFAPAFGPPQEVLVDKGSSEAERHRDSVSVASVDEMTYKIVDPSTLTSGHGPHPAASPFDKRVSEDLGITAFEVYQVELPAGGETVLHDHRDDGVEDLYVILSGTGWAVVDDESVPVRPGLFIAVTTESRRQMRAGDEGLVFVAMCSAPR